MAEDKNKKTTSEGKDSRAYKEREVAKIRKLYPEVKKFSDKFIHAVINNANYIGVNPGVILDQIGHESGFDPSAANSIGARGLFQMLPSTFKGLGLSETDFDGSEASAIKQVSAMKNYYKPYRQGIRNAEDPKLAYHLAGYDPSKILNGGVNNRESKFKASYVKANPKLGKNVGQYADRMYENEHFQRGLAYEDMYISVDGSLDYIPRIQPKQQFQEVTGAQKNIELDNKKMSSVPIAPRSKLPEIYFSFGTKNGVVKQKLTDRDLRMVKDTSMPNLTTEFGNGIKRYNTGTVAVQKPADYDPTGAYVSGGGQVASGTAMLATGNPMGAVQAGMGGLQIMQAYVQDKRNSQLMKEADRTQGTMDAYSNNLAISDRPSFRQASEGMKNTELAGVEGDIVEAERGEVVFRFDSNGKPFLVNDLRNFGQSHKKGGVLINVKEGDMIIPKDKTSGIMKMFEGSYLKNGKAADFKKATGNLPSDVLGKKMANGIKKYETGANDYLSGDMLYDGDGPFRATRDRIKEFYKNIGPTGDQAYTQARYALNKGIHATRTTARSLFNRGREELKNAYFAGDEQPADTWSTDHYNMLGIAKVKPNELIDKGRTKFRELFPKKETEIGTDTTSTATDAVDSKGAKAAQFLSKATEYANIINNIGRGFASPEIQPARQIVPEKARLDRSIIQPQLNQIRNEMGKQRSAVSQMAGSAGQYLSRMRSIGDANLRTIGQVEDKFVSASQQLTLQNAQMANQAKQINLQAMLQKDMLDSRARAKQQDYTNEGFAELAKRATLSREEGYMRSLDDKKYQMDKLRVKYMRERDFKINPETNEVEWVGNDSMIDAILKKIEEKKTQNK